MPASAFRAARMTIDGTSTHERSYSLLVLSGEDGIWAFGNGDYGKLGIGDEDEEPRYTPCQVAVG